MGGGSVPNLNLYLAANFAFRAGVQTKHCDLARSCFSHQSPFFLNSASVYLHIRHSPSGMPCSSHHHPLWSCPFLAALLGLSFAASVRGASLLQPPRPITST